MYNIHVYTKSSRGRKFVASTQLEIGLRCGVSDTHREA